MLEITSLNMSYIWILLIVAVFIIRSLYDANVINGPDNYDKFFSLNTMSETDLVELFLPFILFSSLFKLEFIFNKINSLEDKNKKRINYLILIFNLVILCSYYLTRLKFINGPYNYSNYFGKPTILFK